MVIHRLPNGQWLVSGRTVGEGLALRETLERSLIIVAVVAGLLGLACGAILAQYVGRRSATSRRWPTASPRATSASACRSRQRRRLRPAGQQINAMLDRIGWLMDELRMLTDALAHDLRTPVSRLRAAAHAAAETSDPGEQEELLTKSFARRIR